MASPWALIPIALAVALAWWPLRAKPRRTLWCGTVALWTILAALPWLSDGTSIIGSSALALLSAAALPAKLVDSAVAPQVWTTRRWREWAAFLVAPFVVCFRGHLRDPQRPRAQSALLVLRGLTEMTTGALVLWWAFATDWSGRSVLAEHLAKLVGIYLLALDGLFVLSTGLIRLAGFAIHDLSRHPVLAVTPADFWRRYNRDAARFLLENLFWRLPMRSFAVRTFIVFFANGLVHEYLAWLISGRLLGYQLAFFSLHGMAAALTARWRPTGIQAVVSRSATVLFMVATAWLFLASLDPVVPWIQNARATPAFFAASTR